MFTYIDLFAGCGGLSLGLKRAGGTHVLAVEKSPMASETYFKNLICDRREAWAQHLGSSFESQVEAGLLVGPVRELLDHPEALSQLRSANIDLVAGGPPCQGFSLAGRRKSDDPRNRLAWEFLDVVEATQPKFVLIENVVGIHRKFDAGSARTPFESLQVALQAFGYSTLGMQLNAVHYGAPQSRPRMMILGIRDAPQQEQHAATKLQPWKSHFIDESHETRQEGFFPMPTVESQGKLTVRDAIADLGNEKPREPSDRSRKYRAEMKDAGRWGLVSSGISNLERRSHRPATQDLFRLLQILTDQNLLRVARRARQTNFSGAEMLEFQEALIGVKFPLRSPDGELTVRSGEHLSDLVSRLLTLKHSQTVLDWDQPSRTVVTIPDDYIHPREPRTFSVRELARLQGFPDSFTFHGKVTTGGTSRRTDVPQYSQVGNAVSPYVGLAIGTMIGRANRGN